MEQSVGKPAVIWFGTAPLSVAVLCQAATWHPEQAVELSVWLLLAWHATQGVGVGDMCVPVKANPVVLWLNVAVVQLTVVWHVEQFPTAKVAPAAECGGALVSCQVVKWQPEVPQAVGAIDRE